MRILVFFCFVVGRKKTANLNYERGRKAEAAVLLVSFKEKFSGFEFKERRATKIKLQQTHGHREGRNWRLTNQTINLSASLNIDLFSTLFFAFEMRHFNTPSGRRLEQSSSMLFRLRPALSSAHKFSKSVLKSEYL